MKELAYLLLVTCFLVGCSKEEKEINIFESKIVRLKHKNEWLVVSDRNAGLSVPQAGVALNYNNREEHPSYCDSLFKGDYYTLDEAITGKSSNGINICPNGWRLPNKEELETIAKSMQFSDLAAYLLDSDGNRCYFPLSGYIGAPYDLGGLYWSNTSGDEGVFCLSLSFVTYGMYYSESEGYSVRCVKTEE